MIENDDIRDRVAIKPPFDDFDDIAIEELFDEDKYYPVSPDEVIPIYDDEDIPF